MSSPEKNEKRLPLCGAIRSKGIHMYTEEPPPPVETDTAVWWCVHTCSPVGPDGEAVHRSFCDSKRPCFEGPRA